MTNFSPIPKKCDICECKFEERMGTLMYDASVKGHWGCLCHTCFKVYEGHLGTGQNQKYERQADGEFHLAEGGSQ